MAGEKTEKPTPKKLREARRDGNTPRSSDFTAVCVLLASGATAVLLGPSSIAELSELLEAAIELAFSPDPTAPAQIVARGILAVATLALPVLITAFVAALVVTFLQVGPLFTLRPLQPKGERLNIASGLKRMFDKDRGVDLLKNVLRLSVMVVVGYVAYATSLRAIVGTVAMRPAKSMPVFGHTALLLAAWLVAALAVIAIVDLFLQRYRWFRDLRMSKQEVADEYKESEGDPQMKSRRRQEHLELLRGAGLEDVQRADVVVVNPTHVAAALQYEANEAAAPRVIARGRGPIAAEIKRRARRYRVPIVRDVQLARSLVDVELDHEIPGDLYDAVAEVLHFVYSTREEG